MNSYYSPVIFNQQPPLSQTHSPESVKKDFTILSFILQHAVDNGLCKNNPDGLAIQLMMETGITRSDTLAGAGHP